MTIQTKWNINQRLFAMKNSKVLSVRVSKIEIVVEDGYGSQPPQISTIYHAKHGFMWLLGGLRLPESQLFSTKEELLKSL